jgi:hypothetical protein
MTVPTNKQAAEAAAAAMAVGELQRVDLPARCRLLGLPEPMPDGRLAMRLFGQDVIVAPPDFRVITALTTQPARAGDRLLALHYLLHDLPIPLSDSLITFRDLPGGQFYFGPFLSRSIKPLLQRIGNDLDLLRRHLGRFDWQPIPLGDFAARIHAVGRIEATLVYHIGDDEMGPAAEVLFDACIKRVYCTEDVAAIGSRICLGLL